MGGDASESSSDFSSSEDEDSSDEERSRRVQTILERLSKKSDRVKKTIAKKRSWEDGEEEEQNDEEEEGGDIDQLDTVNESQQNDEEEEGDVDQPADQTSEPDQPAQDQFLPDSYVVAVYDEDWFVAQVVNKTGEPEADMGDQYVYLNFMERLGDSLKWPRRLDMLNTLKQDVLFVCEPPTVSSRSSSSRSVTYTLSKATIKKAKEMFILHQAYYPTIMNLILCFHRVSWGGGGQEWCKNLVGAHNYQF
jgi:hypothetical protein